MARQGLDPATIREGLVYMGTRGRFRRVAKLGRGGTLLRWEWAGGPGHNRPAGKCSVASFAQWARGVAP